MASRTWGQQTKLSFLKPPPDFSGHDFGVKRVSGNAVAQLHMLKNSNVAEAVPGEVEGARSDWKRPRRGRRSETVVSHSEERSRLAPVARRARGRYFARGIDAGLKKRENDPLKAKPEEATRRIGELVMEVEILRKERPGTFGLPEVVEMSPATSTGTNWITSSSMSDRT
jgi:transposase